MRGKANPVLLIVVSLIALLVRSLAAPGRAVASLAAPGRAVASLAAPVSLGGYRIARKLRPTQLDRVNQQIGFSRYEQNTNKVGSPGNTNKTRTNWKYEQNTNKPKHEQSTNTPRAYSRLPRAPRAPGGWTRDSDSGLGLRTRNLDSKFGLEIWTRIVLTRQGQIANVGYLVHLALIGTTKGSTL